MDARWTLHCLGPSARVTRDDDGTVLLSLGKPLALLAYVALSPSRTASRDRLTDLLWGNQESGPARASLRRALTHLRHHISEDVITGDDHSCFVSPALRVDVLEFVAEIERGEFACAVERYPGDLLNDFASPGCNVFEEWAAIERAHLRSLALRATESWTRQCIERGRFGDARRAAARFRVIDPYAELGWRLSLETVAASGDRVALLAEAERFEHWLEVDGREPEPASRELLRAVRQSPRESHAAPPTRATLVGDLVGREREFGALLDAWREASAGRTRVVAVAGGAGLGKSRLLDAVAQRVRSTRRRTLLVRAYPGERRVPRAFLAALVHDVARLGGAAGIPASVIPDLIAIDARLSERFAGVSPRDPTSTTVASRATALRELLAAVCDEAPLALLLDDAHWFDDESRLVIVAALARLERSALLVVITTRGDSHSLQFGDRLQTVSLSALGRSDVAELVSSIGTLPSDAAWSSLLFDRLASASRGVPLYILSALERLVAEGGLVWRDGAWLVDDDRRFELALHDVDPIATRLRELSPSALKLVLMLAIAGVPVPCTLLAGDSNDGALAALERAGLIRVELDSVFVGHDTIADCALHIASHSQRHDAEHAVGLAMVADPRLREHGLRHLAAVNDLHALGAALRLAVSARSQASGDGAARIVASLLGRTTSDPLVRQAVRGLSFGARLGRRRLAWMTAVSTVLIAATGAGALLGHRPDEPSIDIVLREGKTTRVANVTLDRMGWVASSPLVATFVETGADDRPLPVTASLISENGSGWAAEQYSSDGGGADVVLVDRSGATRRLTRAHADETPWAWSPDGRLLAIQSSAFSRDGFRTAALLDVATGKVTPVGGTDLEVGAIKWSPDGTRLAFGAGPFGSRGSQLCVVGAIDGIRQCRPAPHGFVEVGGWLGPERLLASIGAERELVILSPDNAQVSEIGVRSATGDVSPDGKWIIARRATNLASELQLAPTDDPTARRPVLLDRRIADPKIIWHTTTGSPEYLDTLHIDAAGDSIPLGAPFSLIARGVSNRGRALGVNARVWRSLAPAVADIDSTGAVRPFAPGSATIELSAGGWRKTRRTFHVFRAPTRVLLDERWDRPLSAHWMLFGDPSPRLVDDSALGRSFFNAGDGWFFSGAFSRETFDARVGLAVDMLVKLPITRPQHQYAEVTLATLKDVAGMMRTWNGREGYLPSSHIVNACNFSYPLGEGPRAALSGNPFGELTRRADQPRPPLAEGAPTRLRIQVFPDGRCGVALDGEQPWISAIAAPEDDSLRVILQGNSVGTRLLVGPILIRAGVPDGIDWYRAHVAR